MEKEDKIKQREVRAIAKYVRTSPRKAGKICDLVRSKSVKETITILKTGMRASPGQQNRYDA